MNSQENVEKIKFHVLFSLKTDGTCSMKLGAGSSPLYIQINQTFLAGLDKGGSKISSKWSMLQDVQGCAENLKLTSDMKTTSSPYFFWVVSFNCRQSSSTYKAQAISESILNQLCIMMKVDSLSQNPLIPNPLIILQQIKSRSLWRQWYRTMCIIITNGYDDHVSMENVKSILDFRSEMKHLNNFCFLKCEKCYIIILWKCLKPPVSRESILLGSVLKITELLSSKVNLYTGQVKLVTLIGLNTNFFNNLSKLEVLAVTLAIAAKSRINRHSRTTDFKCPSIVLLDIK